MKKIIPFHKEIPFKTNLEEITSISLEHTIHPDGNKVSGDFIVSGEYKISDHSNCVESFSYELPFENEFPNCNLDKAVIDIHDFYYEIINSSILTVHIELCVQNIIEDPIIVKIEPEEEMKVPEKEVEEEKIEALVREKMEEKGPDALEHIEREIQDLFDKEVVSEAVTEPVLETIKEEGVNMEEVKEEPVFEEKNIKEEIPSTDKKEVVSVMNEKVKEVEEAEEIERENYDKIDEILEQMDTKETYATYKIYIVRENDSLETILEKYDTTRDALSMYNDLSELKIGDKIMIPSQNA